MTNEVTKTAPEEIYLQVSPDAHNCEDPFPVCHEEITWCFESFLACEVRYVRADIAKAENERLREDAERWQKLEQEVDYLHIYVVPSTGDAYANVEALRKAIDAVKESE